MPSPSSRPRLFVPLAVLPLLTLFLATRWSNAKLLNQDEMFSYQTDTVHSLAEVFRIQLHFPISLDPLVFHSLAHLCTRFFGPTPFAMRLPSMLGFALMQCCIVLFVYRAARSTHEDFQAIHIAQFAGILPLLTATFFYATEARPYGLLLGFYALALYAWQTATRPSLDLTPSATATPGPWSEITPQFTRDATLTRPRWALPTLALAISLALNSHYFAILLLPVLYLAELVRTLDRRRLDLPMLAALVTGTAAIVFTLPFQKAVREFRTHYYNAGTISPRAVTQAFRSLFLDYTSFSLNTQRILAALFLLLALAFIAALIFRWRTFQLPRAEAALLVATAALPVFGFLLARFVTHSFEVRYVIGALIGITILASLLLAPAIVPATRTGQQLRWLPYLVAIAGLTILNKEIAHERLKTYSILQSLAAPTPVRAALAADPTHTLYIQQMGHYELAQFYQPDPVLRAHTVLVYDSAREIALTGHDTEALTAEHMTHFTALPIVPYTTLAHDPTPHTWLLYTDGWDFAHTALPADHATLTPLAPMFEATATTVHFPAR